MEKSLQELAVECAVETYDHLLWQAIINVCGMAMSRMFEQTENKIRVVYQTFDPGFSGIKDPIDPRKEFSRIETEVKKLISLSLRIHKLGYECRGLDIAESLCSHACYIEFLIFGSKAMSERDRIDLFGLGGIEIPVSCDFVEFGRKGEDGYVCCPCVGQHLENTRDLAAFEIKLQEPERVGKDTYEFRFEIK